MNSTESIPQVWDDARDTAFFRITAGLLPAEFCYGASVLLASYDAEEPALAARTNTTAPARIPAAASNPTATAHVNH